MYREHDFREYLYDHTAGDGDKRPGPYLRSVSGSLLENRRLLASAGDLPGQQLQNQQYKHILNQYQHQHSNSELERQSTARSTTAFDNRLHESLEKLVPVDVLSSVVPTSEKGPLMAIVVADMNGSSRLYRQAMSKILTEIRTQQSNRAVFANVTHYVASSELSSLANHLRHRTSHGGTDAIPTYMPHSSDTPFSSNQEFFTTQSTIPHLSTSPSLSDPPSPTFSTCSSEDYISSPTLTSSTPRALQDNYSLDLPSVEQIPGVFSTISVASSVVDGVVPPWTANFSLTVHMQPVHNYDPVNINISRRYDELAPGGTLLFVHPCSLKFYIHSVLPCLDLALYHMLALNVISSHQCEVISMLPDRKSAPGYEIQEEIIRKLPNAEITYQTKLEDFSYDDWGKNWLHHELAWLKKTIRAASGGHNHSNTILVKLIETMTANKAWNRQGRTDLAVFVVRKKK